MNLTQQRMITYLQEHGTASAAEFAYDFGMTVANIRHHLKILLENRTIELVDYRKRPGRGRSTYVYRLRPDTLVNNLDGLILAMFEASFENLNESQKDDFLRRLASWLGQTRRPLTGHLGSKLTQVVQILDQMHYKARWEAHADAPHVYFHHCPYLQILPKHPELCLVDRYLLENLSGLTATQTARIGPARSCLFLITGHSKA